MAVSKQRSSQAENKGSRCLQVAPPPAWKGRCGGDAKEWWDDAKAKGKAVSGLWRAQPLMELLAFWQVAEGRNGWVFFRVTGASFSLCFSHKSCHQRKFPQGKSLTETDKEQTYRKSSAVTSAQVKRSIPLGAAIFPQAVNGKFTGAAYTFPGWRRRKDWRKEQSGAGCAFKHVQYARAGGCYWMCGGPVLRAIAQLVGWAGKGTAIHVYCGDH